MARAGRARSRRSRCRRACAGPPLRRLNARRSRPPGGRSRTTTSSGPGSPRRSTRRGSAGPAGCGCTGPTAGRPSSPPLVDARPEADADADLSRRLQQARRELEAALVATRPGRRRAAGRRAAGHAGPGPTSTASGAARRQAEERIADLEARLGDVDGGACRPGARARAPRAAGRPRPSGSSRRGPTRSPRSKDRLAEAEERSGLGGPDAERLPGALDRARQATEQRPARWPTATAELDARRPAAAGTERERRRRGAARSRPRRRRTAVRLPPPLVDNTPEAVAHLVRQPGVDGAGRRLQRVDGGVAGHAARRPARAARRRARRPARPLRRRRDRRVRRRHRRPPPVHGPGPRRSRRSSPTRARSPTTGSWRWCRRMPGPAPVLVVTSDRELRDRVRSAGANVVSAAAVPGRCSSGSLSGGVRMMGDGGATGATVTGEPTARTPRHRLRRVRAAGHRGVRRLRGDLPLRRAPARRRWWSSLEEVPGPAGAQRAPAWCPGCATPPAERAGPARARGRPPWMPVPPPTISTLRAAGAAAGLDAVGVAPAEPFLGTRAHLEERKAAGLHGGMQFTYRRPERSTDPAPHAAGRPLPGGRGPPLPGAVRADRAAGRRRRGSPRYASDDHYGALRAGLGRGRRRLLADGGLRGPRAGRRQRPGRPRGRLPRPGSAGTARTPTCCCPGRAAGSCSARWSPTPTSSRPPSRWPTAAARAAAASTAARPAPSSPPASSTPAAAWPGWSRPPGTFPVEHRAALGDRIYGCDDCQEVCPPNRRARRDRRRGAGDGDRAPGSTVLDLLAASDDELLARHGRWYIADARPRHLRRNALVVLGNVGDGADAERRRGARRATCATRTRCCGRTPCGPPAGSGAPTCSAAGHDRVARVARCRARP